MGKENRKMRYDYVCNDCSEEDTWFCFEVNYPMDKKPKKVKCPECNGVNTEQMYLSVPIVYTRGYGWLDVKGRRRDLSLWQLKNDDPYKSMRQPGEASDLADKLRRGGKHNPNPKKFYVKK
jgi:predicted nucleic acid-binding Zn ribbon protein